MTAMYARDSIQVKVLRYIEELVKDRAPDARQVDTDMVCLRMRQEGQKARDEVAEAMSDLLAGGYVEGKEMRGDNKAMDVTVTAITEKGIQLLAKRG
jgi:hypothetical protein